MNNPLSHHAGTTTGPSAGPGSSSGDPRIVAAIEEYLAAARAGSLPDRSEFLARHGEIAGELAECLDGLDFIREAAGSQDPGGEPDPGPRFEPAASLGDFRIVRELGRGGMGVVYEAEQVSLGRRVALKVLPFASAIDPRRIQRFRVEAQAAAQLHHPHIVPIFAVGCDRGVHYYAMQLIEGRTLAAVVDGPGGPAGAASDMGAVSDSDVDATTAAPVPSPAPELPCLKDLTPPSSPNASGAGSNTPRSGWARFRAIARLGVQAAEALEHAHGLGIVHRDVKPGNLMIDAEGEVWITDFGLARYREEGGLTRSGDLLGTLRYMSPEQARAGGAIVDQRTDIYSLGATLYELTTLRPAFGGRDRQELLRRVTHDDPPAPRRFDPTIPRDLETVIMKAMAKEPASRYTSAQELADDLRRFQEHKPIHARRPTPVEHLAKWARRHRASVVTTAIALLLASAVAAGLLWGEQRKTAKALDDLKAIRERERSALSVLLLNVESLTMVTMQRWTVGQSGPEPLSQERRSFLEQALRNYDGLIAITRADSEVRMREVAAKAYFGRGIALMILEQPGAADSCRESVAIYEALLRDFPGQPAYLFGLAASIKFQAESLFRSGDVSGASTLFSRLFVHERELISMDPESAEYRSFLKNDLTEWGNFLATARPSPETMRALEELVAADPSNDNALNSLAWQLASRPDAPPHDAARALEYAERAVKLNPKPPAAYWNTLGVARLRNGRPDAVEALEHSLHEGSSGQPALDWFGLAIVHARKGDAEKARKLYDQADAWTRLNASKVDQDLREFQSEARKALGLPEHDTPAPARASGPTSGEPASPTTSG